MKWTQSESEPELTFMMVAVVPWLASGPVGGGAHCPQAGTQCPFPVGAALSQRVWTTGILSSLLISWPREDLSQSMKLVEEAAFCKET